MPKSPKLKGKEIQDKFTLDEQLDDILAFGDFEDEEAPAAADSVSNNSLPSSDEDIGSGAESNYSGDEHMFFFGIDPVEDTDGQRILADPRSLAGHGTKRKRTANQTTSNGKYADSSEDDEEWVRKVPSMGFGEESNLAHTLSATAPASSAAALSPSTPQSATKSSQRSTSLATPQPSGEHANRWRNETEQDVEPTTFKFAPSRSPGSQLGSVFTYGIMQIFQLFFPKFIVDAICRNTNKNAERKLSMGQKFAWAPLLAEEFYKYLGLLLFHGIARFPAIKDYWSTDQVFAMPFIRSVMARNRFQAISWCLHISDPDEDEKMDKKKGTPDYDSLFRLQPLMSHITMVSQTWYQPRQNLYVDERMVPTKAKNGLKNYMRLKPHKWGYKLFVLTDSSNGYICNLKVYLGKQDFPEGHGLSYDSVISLVDNAKLGHGYNIYCDSYYTSPRLFQELIRRKMGACGAIRESRKGFPSTAVNSLSKSSARGTMRWLRQGDMVFVKWLDTREVAMCSTIHKAFDGPTVKRSRSMVDGTWKTRTLLIPTPIKEYNKHMGGFDLSSIYHQRHTVTCKTRWYKTFFFHLLDIAVVNSFILYKEHCYLKGLKPLTHLGFRKQLTKQLLGAPSGPAPRQSTNAHIPLPTSQHIGKSTKATLGRKYCEVCRRKGRNMKTPWECRQCQKAFCLILDRNCWAEWHS